MLKTMLEVQAQNNKQDVAQIALVTHSLAMLWFLGGSRNKVKALDARVHKPKTKHRNTAPSAVCLLAP